MVLINVMKPEQVEEQFQDCLIRMVSHGQKAIINITVATSFAVWFLDSVDLTYE